MQRMAGRRPMRVLAWDEWQHMIFGLHSSTDDDVSITTDGRRLDTVEKVIEFSADLAVEFEGRRAAGAWLAAAAQWVGQGVAPDC